MGAPKLGAMKKGCIIAIVVVLVLGLIVGGVVVYFASTKGAQAVNSGVAFAVETAIEAYQTQNPDAQIPTTNEDWAKALEGFSLPDGQNMSELVQNGKLVDVFQNALKLEEGPDGKIRVISPGKDGEFGTDDDADSSMMRGLMGGAEATP